MKPKPPKESAIVQSIIGAVTNEYPDSWVRKLNDRTTRGLPDIVIVLRWEGVCFTLFVEAKRPGGRESALQVHERQKVTALGGCWIVATSADVVLAYIKVMTGQR